jgi:hypothetical protein
MGRRLKNIQTPKIFNLLGKIPIRMEKKTFAFLRFGPGDEH